jgi:methionine--tRNA ligase beta chain
MNKNEEQVFSIFDIRLGKIVEANPHPNINNLIVLRVDFENEQRQIVTAIYDSYTIEEIIGKNIVVLLNIVPHEIRGILNQGLCLSVSIANGEYIIFLTSNNKPGTKIEVGIQILQPSLFVTNEEINVLESNIYCKDGKVFIGKFPIDNVETDGTKYTGPIFNQKSVIII